ncbi:MAG: hypothetical protein WD025_00305 [Bacteriovoracaceae bacterium]
MRLEVVTKKTREHFLMEGIQNSIAPELNIYNQAHLEIDRPLVKASRIHKKTNNEIGVIFNVEGELKGKIICLVDLYEKKLDSEKMRHFQSLFTESMNILAGQLLTSFEEETGLMSVITQPKIISRSETFEKIGMEGDLKLSLGYKLITELEDYDCRIYILANEARVREV